MYDDEYNTILPEFTFESEVNPSNLSYEEAVELSKIVLPDDIEEVSETEHNSGYSAGRSMMYYKSSIGNFKVSFTHPYKKEGTILNKDKVVGISYMIEIVE